jgi:hypothetical protein
MAIELQIQNEHWREWARGVRGAQWIEGNLTRDHAVVVPVGKWPVTIDIHRAGDWRRRTFHTRAHTPFESGSGFQFKLTRKLGQNALDDLERATGFHLGKRIETRDAMFNQNYILKSNDEVKARALFENPRVRSGLPSQIAFTLQAGKANVLARHLPQGGGFLCFHTDTVFRHPKELSGVCNLFGELLRALHPTAI